MNEYPFTLILSGVSEITSKLADALDEATGGDIELNMRDGVAFAARRGDFALAVDDDIGFQNRWAIEKTGDKFVFQFACVSPMEGFEKGDGSIYSYRSGDDPETGDWPSVEFGNLPRHCLLTKEQVGPLLVQRCRAENPGETAGVVYGSDSGEHVC